MSENYYSPQEPLAEVPAGESLGRYTAKTFGLMFLGLLVTFGIGYYLSNTFSGFLLLYKVIEAVPYIHLILLVAELVVVIAMTAMLNKMSPVAAAVCFFVYAALTGMTFGVIFLAYNLASVVLVFGFTALYFGGMAVFGYFTSIDLSRIRNVLFFGLIFLIIANVIMFFIPAVTLVEQIICTVGVIVFLAYTAYDTQKIKAFYTAYAGDPAMLKKACIFSALQLYLDFINLFLYLLRLFGKAQKN